MSPTIAVIAALAGALVTWLVAARRFSGKIATTEAKDLWEEARSIRGWAYEEINSLRERLDEAEGAYEKCRKENKELRIRITTLEQNL